MISIFAITIGAVVLGTWATDKARNFVLEHQPYVELPLSTEAHHAIILRIRENVAGIGITVSITNGLLAGILAALILQLLHF